MAITLTPQEAFANALYMSSTNQEISQVCEKVGRLASAIMTIQERIENKTIMYYKIDDSLTEAVVEERHLFWRIGTNLSLYFDQRKENEKELVKYRFLSLAYRVLGLSLLKTHGFGERVPLEVNGTHFLPFINPDRADREAWKRIRGQTRDLFNQTYRQVEQALHAIRRWKSDYYHDLPYEFIQRIEECTQATINSSVQPLPAVYERICLQTFSEFQSEVESELKQNPNSDHINQWVRTRTNGEKVIKTTLLHFVLFAIPSNEIRFKALEFLIEKGANPLVPDEGALLPSQLYSELRIDDPKTWDLLQQAQQDYQQMRELIESKNLNKLSFFSDRPNLKCSFFHQIVRQKRTYLFKALMENADVKCVDSQGNTILHEAAKTYNPETIMKLIRAYGQLVNEEGMTPRLTTLLENIKNSEGKTPKTLYLEAAKEKQERTTHIVFEEIDENSAEHFYDAVICS